MFEGKDSDELRPCGGLEPNQVFDGLIVFALPSKQFLADCIVCGWVYDYRGSWVFTERGIREMVDSMRSIGDFGDWGVAVVRPLYNGRRKYRIRRFVNWVLGMFWL